MKQTLRFSIAIVVILLAYTMPARAQCANDNALVAGDLTPPGVGQSTSQTYAAGQYMLAYVQSGASYTVSCCGASWDTQLTVYYDLTGTYIAYNDDFCGLQSTVTFTPTTCGLVRILLDQYFCTASANTAVVTMTQNTAGAGIPTMSAAPDVAGCNGSTVTIGIANNGSGGTLPYTYSWTPSTNLASTTVSQTTGTVTATQSYTLTLTDANDCIARDTVLVTMLNAPVVNLGADTMLCGGSITLNAGNPGSSYLWNTGAGTQMLTVNQTGSYSVAVQDPSGCISSDNINIVVNTPPAVSLGPDTTTCANSIMLDAGPGFAAYNWTTGDVTQTATVTSSGPVVVAVTDTNGCVGTDTNNVTLSPPPAVNLGPDTVKCGGSVVLDAGNPGSLYFWSDNTSSQTTSATQSGTYYVTVVTQTGCTNSDTVMVTINSAPVVDLGPDTLICGTSIMLNAGNPGDTYLWSNNATTQTTSVGSGMSYVTVADPSGCVSSDTIMVSSNPVPSVSAGSDVTICPNQSATLTASGAIAYQWSNGATTANTTVNPSSTTTYYVTGYDANGCSASDVVLVTLLPGSNAMFTDMVSGATATFTNQSTNAVSYTWDFGDGSPADNSANPSHTYTANGTYTVTLTVTGPCGTDTYTQVVTITQVGLQDIDLSNSLSLFPNPNDGRFTLSFDFTKAKDVTIQVLDITGRIIYSDQENGIMSYNKQIGLADAQSGMYQVRIITTEGVVTKKIVIER